MSAFCCFQQKNMDSGQYRVFVFSFLLVFLFMGVTLLLPGNTLAKIHVWKDGEGKIHLTDRPPPVQFSSKNTIPDSAPEEKLAVHSEADANVQKVVDAVETAFTKNDIDSLLRLYTVAGRSTDEAEERIAKEAVARSLEKFVDAFGVPGKFAPIPEKDIPEQYLQDDYIPRDCTPSFRGFSFPLAKSNATGLVFMTICGAGQQATLVSFNYDLQDPTPEQQKIFADITSETLKQVATQLQQQAASKSQTQTPPTPKKQAAVRTPAAKKPAQSQHPQPGAATKAPASTFPQGSGGLPGVQQQGAVSLPGTNFTPGMDPFAVAQMASMFTGTAMMVQIAVSLLFYFFTSLCIYLIARKTNTGGAWLAWVPILQMFPMIQSAGIAWWWGLVLYFAPIPLVFIPLLGMIVMILWMVVMIVFFALVWMRISERLGMSKWLGLVIFVPLFNMVIMALLAFTGKSTGPEISLKSVVSRTVLAFVLATLVFCGGMYLYVMPLMEGLISHTATMHQFTAPGVSKPMPGAVRPAPAGTQQMQQRQAAGSIKNLTTPTASLDTAYYEALFKQKAPDFSDDSFEKGRPESCVGPACVLLSNFWDQQDTHVWLKVRIPDIPYMTLFDSSIMSITDVLNKSGKNVYNASSNFESEHFLNLNFMQHSGGYLEAIRDVHLLPGTKEADLQSIHGELQFKFPLNVAKADFTAKDSGQRKTLAGLEVTLEKLEGNSADIKIVGDIDRYIGVNAYDASGNELEAGGSSSMTSENKKSGNYSFQGNISVLRVFCGGERYCPRAMRLLYK